MKNEMLKDDRHDAEFDDQYATQREKGFRDPSSGYQQARDDQDDESEQCFEDRESQMIGNAGDEVGLTHVKQPRGHTSEHDDDRPDVDWEGAEYEQANQISCRITLL